VTRARNTAKRTDFRAAPTAPVHSDDEAMLCRRTCGTETWHRKVCLPVFPSEGKPFMSASYVCRNCEPEAPK
jgi:hypothetical protein